VKKDITVTLTNDEAVDMWKLIDGCCPEVLEALPGLSTVKVKLERRHDSALFPKFDIEPHHERHARENGCD